MALTAFAVRSGEETKQVQVVCLDDLVPVDDDLRRIEVLIDWEHVRRQTHAEGAIAELKHHGMGRARCRGTRKTQVQLLAAAPAINLKRLLTAQDALWEQPLVGS